MRKEVFMGFPSVIGAEALSRHDFFRFELQFTKTVLDFFPCDRVQFISEGLDEQGMESVQNCNLSSLESGLSEGVRAGVNLVRLGRKPVVDAEALVLFLPILSNADLLAVVVLSGGGRDLFGGYSEDWLLERVRLVSREFSLIKRWAQDSTSGVLNATHLRQELTMLHNLAGGTSALGSWKILLIEVVMRGLDAGQALRNISQTAAYLDSLLGDMAPVHHLGVGVFALIWRGGDLDEVQKLGYTLLRKLKRQGTQKVHLGIAAFDASEHLALGKEDEACSKLASLSEGADHLLDKAWDALCIARQRGAFALCVASSEAKAREHLLAPLAPEVLAHVKRLWQGENQFSVILMQKDRVDQVNPASSVLDEGASQSPLSVDMEFPNRVRVLVGEGVALQVLDANRALICLPGIDEQVAADWACGLANRIMPLGIGSFSMGIASYPCPGFHKADIPQNAKKALVHTQFFGAGTITSFSGVSLNISGDVYYNEGDLVSAIREYRLGLNLNPDNVNLLNSLGVIYAQIDSHAKAIPLFEKAIALNPNDFMARYNLGFAHLCSDEQDKALSCFEQAEKIDDSYFDLLLQLGQLYCQRGQYKGAVRVLAKAEKSVSAQALVRDGKPWERCEPWHGENHELGYGLVYRYLGEAYKGIGKNREAMTYLQRAARYNSRDSEALSQLGELYASEQQGLDISLAFCRQAVEIESGKASHWYRMGKVLFCREEWAESLDAVQQCLALDAKHIDALMLKASIHEKVKQMQLARLAYERVLTLEGTHSRAAKALKKINQIRR
jgi:tetratricopeptide (TPR) repeat protein